MDIREHIEGSHQNHAYNRLVGNLKTIFKEIFGFESCGAYDVSGVVYYASKHGWVEYDFRKIMEGTKADFAQMSYFKANPDKCTLGHIFNPKRESKVLPYLALSRLSLSENKKVNTSWTAEDVEHLECVSVQVFKCSCCGEPFTRHLVLEISSFDKKNNEVKGRVKESPESRKRFEDHILERMKQSYETGEFSEKLKLMRERTEAFVLEMTKRRKDKRFVEEDSFQKIYAENKWLKRK